MSESNIQVVCVKPNETPIPIYIKNDLLHLNRLVNIDKYGNECDEIKNFEIVEIKDNINIVSSPNAEERELPLVRKVGKFSKFYGVMYIVKMDASFNLISLTAEEAVDYCMKFLHDEISMETLGFEVACDVDDGNRLIDIWCDEW
jgi:hypothetical protein